MKPTGKKETLSYNFKFEGILSPSVNYKLTIELMKFVLYQRQQIPLPYEHLKQQITKQQQEYKDITEINSRKRKVKSLSDKKAEHVLQAAEDIFCNLNKIFDSAGQSITQVAFLLGATVVSPKEVYLLKFPTDNYTGNMLTPASCVRILFRQLVSQDIFGSLTQISSTNFHILLEAPRDSGLEWLYPKDRYKIPVRGRHINFNLIACGELHEDLSVLDDTSFNISGVEPLETSTNEASFHGTVEEMCLSSGSDSGVCEEDLIWYQVPVNLKGFRDKICRTPLSSDIWA